MHQGQLIETVATLSTDITACISCSFWKSMAAGDRYKGCHGEAAYDGEVCTTLEQSCFACYCSIAVEEFTGFTYCQAYWAKYLIQVTPTLL